MTARRRQYTLLVRLLHLPAALSVLLVLAAPAVFTYAQRSTQPLPVDAMSAHANFPDSVEFSLRAHGFKAERAELNYRLVGESITSGLQAEVASGGGDDVSTQVTLDLGTNYIPPGAEVAYYWSLSGQGRDAITPEQTFVLLDERHKWNNLADETARVAVHWFEGDSAFGKKLLQTASNAVSRLQTAIGSKLERPANVWVYPSQDELIDALPKNIPEWVGGKAFPEYSLVLAAIAPDASAEEEIGRTVPHELSHLLMYQATRNPYNAPPAWMDEGLAVHNEVLRDPTYDETVRRAAEAGKLIPLRALGGSFGADEESALLSYAESRSVIDFVMSSSKYGPNRFSRTVAAFKGGVTYDDALKAGLGVTTDELDRDWRASLPYKAAASGAVPRSPGSDAPNPNSGPALTPSLGTSLALLAVGGCLGAFLLGAVLTLVVALRRRGRAA